MGGSPSRAAWGAAGERRRAAAPAGGPARGGAGRRECVHEGDWRVYTSVEPSGRHDPDRSPEAEAGAEAAGRSRNCRSNLTRALPPGPETVVVG